MTLVPFSSAFRGGTGKSKQSLKTAAKIFSNKGYHQTTVDEIARALGVAKGTIYYHFKNKEELYLAIIREGVYLLEEQMRLDISGANTAAGKIKKLIGSMLAFIEDKKDLVFLFLKELYGTGIQREELAKMISGSLGLIRVVIEEGVKDGSFKKVDPEITTSSLFGMIIISALHYISYARSIPHAQVSASIEQVFFAGILWPDTREGL
jgi:AcrR family transcriptional regulator